MKKQESLLRIQSETAESARIAARLLDQIRSSSDLRDLAKICTRDKTPLKKHLTAQAKACFCLTKKYAAPFDLARELIEDCIDDVSAPDQEAVEKKLSATLEYASRMLWNLYKSNDSALRRWDETEYQYAFNYIIGIQAMCFSLGFGPNGEPCHPIFDCSTRLAGPVYLFKETTFDDQCRQFEYDGIRLQIEINKSMKTMSLAMAFIASLTLIATIASVACSVASIN